MMHKIVEDSLLNQMSLSGQSKQKEYSFGNFKNFSKMLYNSFELANQKNNDINVPTKSKFKKALSAVIRHASERMTRAEKDRQQQQ